MDGLSLHADQRGAARVLGREASLAVAAGVVAHTLWTSAAPTMAYQLYARDWQLSHTVTTGIFAIYPIVVVTVLTGFGDLSDHIGRRTTMLMGLAASLAGTLLFALAPDVVWLFAGRALMGIGVGLSAGPSTAAVVEFSTGGRAPLITTVAQAAGFAAALLIGGALTEYAPWPTRLSFWLLAGLLALLFAATWFLPRHVGGTPGGWRPRAPGVPRAVRKAFPLAAIAMMTAYTHGVLVLSLGGQVAHDLVGSRNAFVNGAVLALFPVLLGVVGILGRRIPRRPAMALGALASAAGMGLLAVAVAWHSLAVFLLATATSGVGYSLLFRGGLQVIEAATAPRHRGGVLSALYLLAYLSMGIVALVLGSTATARGLGFAVDLGAGVVGVLSAATLLLAVAGRSRLG